MINEIEVRIAPFICSGPDRYIQLSFELTIDGQRVSYRQAYDLDMFTSNYDYLMCLAAKVLKDEILKQKDKVNGNS